MADKQYDIYSYETDILPVNFDAGQLSEIRGRNISSSTCRVVRDGKAGYTASNTLPEDVMIDNATEIAQYGKEINIELPEPSDLGDVNVYSQKTADLSSAKMVDWGKRIIDGTVKGIGKDLPIDVEIERTISDYTLRNSEGISYNHRYTEVSAFCSLTDAEEGDIHTVFDLDFSWDADDIDIDSIINFMVEFYKKGQQTTTVKTGKMPVLLHPYALTQFLEPFIVGINGEQIKYGTSPLTDKLGDSIFHERVTMYDDPFWADSPGSAPFDGEGFAARKRPLVDNGVLRSFNHSLETAKAVGDEPTGGSIRSSSGKPMPGLFNLIMEPGDTPYKDIVSSVDNGLFLRYLSGSGQANMLAGEFSMGIYSGYLIENGKITKRLKNVMVAGNVYDVFKQVADISEERLMCFGAKPAQLPYVLLDDVSAAGN
ncbi:MAG: TldD/PmbA family protein [bacterium]|nr:TldD/PmbA family protein [bacterium]